MDSPKDYIATALAMANAFPMFDDVVDFCFTKGNTRKLKHVIQTTPVRTDPKINRNALRPCGSGLKFKKCCIDETDRPAAEQ